MNTFRRFAFFYPVVISAALLTRASLRAQLCVPSADSTAPLTPAPQLVSFSEAAKGAGLLAPAEERTSPGLHIKAPTARSAADDIVAVETASPARQPRADAFSQLASAADEIAGDTARAGHTEQALVVSAHPLLATSLERARW